MSWWGEDMTGNHGTPDRRPDTDRLWAARQSANSRIPAWKPPASQAQSSPAPEPPEVMHPLDTRRVDAKKLDAKKLDAKRDPKTASPQTTQATPPAIKQSVSVKQPVRRSVSTPSPSSPSPSSSTKHRFSLSLSSLKIPRSWQFWGATAVLAFSGIGVLSALALFRLPSLPNCPAIFLPTASASLRIYCAQVSAEQRTVDSLLKAISLLNGLPKDHPLQDEINRNIEAWAKEILELAEESFQRGNLSEAIATAKRIPKNTSARQLVDQQVQDWQTTWAKAEEIYQEAEAALQEQNLRQAFLIATRLLDIDNDYWETTKYRELNNLITATREDGNKLGEAKALADEGGLDNLLKAIKLAGEVKQTSPLYKKAQKLTADFGQDMLDLAEAVLDRRDYDGAINVVAQIPDSAGLKQEIKDFRILAEAQAQAWSGTVDDIEAAILRAQKLGRDRPLFGRAQQLISYWQLEIRDVQRLATARQIAQGGTVGDLRAAIAEAEMIPSSNPRGSEAQKEINQWRASIETVEDRPYLNRAEQLAASGDVSSLQSAINEASRITSGRALYDEAQEQIASWQYQVERIQDQPLLDQARLMANSGNLVDAINLASRISSGRALYDDAQTDVNTWTNQLQRAQDQPLLDLARRYAARGNLVQAINTAQQITEGRVLYDDAQAEIAAWQGQADGQTRLQQATDAAGAGTTAMLLTAIQIANEIPAENPSRVEADQLISRWSWQLLQIAETVAVYDPAAAISTAQSIPSFTEAYSAAQEQIRSWQQTGGETRPQPRSQSRIGQPD